MNIKRLLGRRLPPWLSAIGVVLLGVVGGGGLLACAAPPTRLLAFWKGTTAHGTRYVISARVSGREICVRARLRRGDTSSCFPPPVGRQFDGVVNLQCASGDAVVAGLGSRLVASVRVRSPNGRRHEMMLSVRRVGTAHAFGGSLSLDQLPVVLTTRDAAGRRLARRTIARVDKTCMDGTDRGSFHFGDL